jgi:hypothetical protein
MSHFTALSIFAFLVSVVFAGINKSTFRAQLKYGAFVFVAFLAVALSVGWIMYPFPL